MTNYYLVVYAAHRFELQAAILWMVYLVRLRFGVTTMAALSGPSDDID